MHRNQQKKSRVMFWLKKENIELSPSFSCTGKFLSEAFILTSTNPQYDKRLFIDLPVQYMKIPTSEHSQNIFCTYFFSFSFDIQNNLCTQQGQCSELGIFMC